MGATVIAPGEASFIGRAHGVAYKSQLDAARTPGIFADKFHDYSSVGKWHCCNEAKSTSSS
jgi:hypothetical protein